MRVTSGTTKSFGATRLSSEALGPSRSASPPASVLGRYHYVTDAWLGVLVALAHGPSWANGVSKRPLETRPEPRERCEVLELPCDGVGRQEHVTHGVKAGRRGNHARNRVHDDRRGCNITMHSAPELDVEGRRPANPHRVVRLWSA